MATYSITSGNWNDPSFWSSISESAAGHILDFSALPSNFAVDFDPATGLIAIFDGTSSFTIGDSAAGGTPDVVLGGTTLLEFSQTL